MEFRNLKAQYAALKPRMDAAIAESIASGHYITGPQVGELENALASYVGTKHCITCANGTDALQLALMAWGIGEGDAVIVPDFTFFSSGEVVSSVGATPVFIDVDEATFNVDPAQVEAGICLARKQGLRPKAVVAVDLFGLPADYATLRKVCDELGLLLLEDGAQGFGGSIGRKMACSFGDISTTSFFPAKPLGCYGDGGAVFTDDDEWASLIRSYAVHGKGSMKYDNVRIGMNSRLDTVQAAVLLVKLAAFVDFELDAVNKKAARYDTLLEESLLCVPYVPEGCRSSWAQYTVVIPKGCNRAAIQADLKGQGIPTMVYYPKPMHEQKAFAGHCLTMPGGCPVTQRLCDSVLSLPMSPYLSDSELEMTANALVRAVE